jgi:hypothetical protein
LNPKENIKAATFPLLCTIYFYIKLRNPYPNKVRNIKRNIKVRGSLDWGKLQMVLLDRFELHTILLNVYF